MNKKGFTLLEVLITASIMGIMGIGIMFFIVRSNAVMDKSVKQAFAHTNAVNTLNMLSKDIREGAILESGTFYTNSTDYPGTSFDMKIRNPDGVTEHIWSIKQISSNPICYRITRDGKEIPFIGDISNTSNYVLGMYKTDMVGEYFYADITFRIHINGEDQYIGTVAYCRHDPTGYFDPQDYVRI